MSKKDCILVPQVNGEPSALYQDLLDLVGDRLVTNYLYAAYLQKGVQEAMSNNGFELNAQKQHNAKDVFDFLEGKEMIEAINKSLPINKDAERIKAKDKLGKFIDYTNPLEAYEIAKKYNDSNKGRLAYVVQDGNVFHIILQQRDSRTQHHISDMNNQRMLWDELFQQFNAKGIDLNNLLAIDSNVINPANIMNFLKSTVRLANIQKKNLSEQQVRIMLEMNKTLPEVQNALQRWGSLDQTVTELMNMIHSDNYSSFGFTLLHKMQSNSSQIAQQTLTFLDNKQKDFKKDNYELDLTNTIKELQKEYGINNTSIVKVGKKIETLSDAALEAIAGLERQLRNEQEKRKQNKTTEKLITKNIYQLIDDLQGDLTGYKYYRSMLDYFSQATNYLNSVNKMLENLKEFPQDGTMADYIKARAEALMIAKNLRDCYYDVVKSIAYIEDLGMDEYMPQDCKENLQKTAKDLLELFDRQEGVLRDIQEDAVTDQCIEVLGEDPYGVESIANIVNMSSTDVNLLDKLYSIGRANNPLVGVLGQIIQDAQEQRNERFSDISRRIDAATKKLYKAGYNSTFMYGEDGRIISDIDWERYYKSIALYVADLKKQGIRGFNLQEAILKWEDENLEEDTVYGTQQRIPNQKFRVSAENSPLNNLSTAQIEYYNTMMHIYGELQSMIPERFQDIYRPPYVRKSWMSIITDTINGRHSLKEGINLLLNRMKFWENKIDDSEYGQVEVGGNIISPTKGKFDDTKKKVIPIFYISKLEDMNDLELNFSMAVQRFASTACNYSCLSEVQDVVEMISDYISTQSVLAPSDRDWKVKAGDYIRKSEFALMKLIRKSSYENGTAELVQSYVDAQMYGIKSKDDPRVTKLINTLIGYNSMQALTVNIVGGVSNTLVGEWQMMIEAGAGEYYNFKDYGVAKARIFQGTVGDAMDLITMNINSKAGLLADFFDPMQETFSDGSRRRYYKSPFRQIFGGFDTQFVYSTGEKLIHYTNMYAVLEHEKVVYKGKEVSLFSVLEKSKDENGVPQLKVKDGAKTLEGNEIDIEYLRGIKRRIKEVNQQTHGAMNTEDKGVLSQRMLGRLVLNFRQWMIEHYSRRYRGLFNGKTHYENAGRDVSLTQFYHEIKVKVNGKTVDLYDAFDKEYSEDDNSTFILKLKENVTTKDGRPVTEEWVDKQMEKWKREAGNKEGYYTTFFHFTRQFLRDFLHHRQDIVMHWNEMTSSQRHNVKRAEMEILMFFALVGVSRLLGSYKDHDDDYWRRFWILQTKRLLVDVKSSLIVMPISMAESFLTILNGPIPAASTFVNLFYPITGLFSSDIHETYQKGRYKSKNKYVVNSLRYTVPFYRQIDNLIHIGDEDNLFKVYESKRGTRYN